MPGATRTIVINATPEKCFDVIVDYERYSEFLPEVKKTRAVNRRGNECDVQYEAEVVKLIKYSVHLKEERPTRVSWTYIDGDFMRDNKGGWVLEAQADGSTKATYTVEIALGPLVPKSIVNALVDTSLPKLLENFKKRIESRP
jgi:coenzyme Q-binding protein COQ10